MRGKFSDHVLRLSVLVSATLLIAGCRRGADDDIETVRRAYTIAKSALIAVNANDVWVETSTTTAPYLSPPIAASSEVFSGSVTTLVADVNGDTWSDLIAVNSTSVFVKTATPSLVTPRFAAATSWSSQGFSGTRATIAADVNGDGKADLIAWNDGTVDVKPAGDGAFAATVRWSTEAFFGTRANVVGDINGDGKTDLIAWNDASVYVKLSSGTAFGPATLWSSQSFFGTRANVVGDINGDGKADLVAWNDAAAFVKLSTASGFGPMTQWSAVPFFGSRANLIGDINLDGKADLIAINDAATYAVLSSGVGFGAPQLLSSVPFFGGVGTFVGGLAQKYSVLKSDLFAIKSNEVWVEPSTSAAPYLGSPLRASAEAFFGASATLVGDVNGDTWSDLIAVNAASVYIKTAIPSAVSPQFSAATAWSSETFSGSRATLAADVSGDGKVDLVAWNDNTIRVKLSTGSAFAASTQLSSEPFFGTRANVSGDVNGDGKADLIAWNDASTYVKLSTGMGFGPATLWSNALFFGGRANLVGDVNGDGWADLIAWNDASTYVKLSNGSSGFGAATAWSSVAFFGTHANLVGDLNQDGLADLIAINETNTYLQLSTRTSFGPPQLISSNAFFGTVGTYVGTATTVSAGWAPLPPLDVSTSVQTSMTASTPPATTVARNQNGSLELLALNANGSPVRTLAGPGTPSWSTLGNLSGAGAMLPLASPPVVATNLDGRLEAFARGADSAIWRVAQTAMNGPWGSWQSLGGTAKSAPAAARNGANELMVIAVKFDGTAMARSQTTAGGSMWSAWSPLPQGVVLRSDPVCARDANGDVNLFARGPDEAIWTSRRTIGLWTTWQRLGGIIKGRFGVSLNGNQGLEIVGIDYSNNLATNGQDSPIGTWRGWSSLPLNKLASGVAVVRRSTGALEAFAVASDKKVWRLAQTRVVNGAVITFPWGAWEALGQTATSAPAVAEADDGSLQLHARASSLQLARSSLPANSSTWSSWTEISGAVRLPSHDPPTTPGRVLTQHNDNARTGANLVETKLNAFNVSPHQFGVLFRRRVDGDVTAQPLFVPQISVHDNNGVDKGVHDVVIVATAHNTIYAFDANDPQAVAPLWTKHLRDSIAMPNRDFGNLADGVVLQPNQDVWICDRYKGVHQTGDPYVPPSDAERRVTPKHHGYNVREIGVIGTPVVDPATNTLYVVSFGVDPAAVNPPLDCLDLTTCKLQPPCTGPGYSYQLHAIDLTTHLEKFGGPVTLTAAVAANSLGSVGGMLTFVPTLHMQRPALLLATAGATKTVYIGFAGFGDVSDWHGWLLARDAATLADRGAYVTTRAAGTRGGGIWQSGQGPAADSSGNVYFATGNGDPGSFVEGVNASLSNAVIKLEPDLDVASYFEPEQGPGVMNGNDIDLGSAGPMLIPNSNRLAMIGKIGIMYVLNRGSLGGYLTLGGRDNVVQEFWATQRSGQACNYSHVHGSPVYWQGAAGGHLYVWGEEDNLRSFALNATGLVPTSGLQTCEGGFSVPVGVPEGRSGPTSATPTPGSMPGGMLSVSALGSLSGSSVVWATRPLSGTALWEVPTGLLEAYDASNLATKLWDSGIVAEDTLGQLARFTAPTVANGKVYVATFASGLDMQNVPYAELVVYGAK